MANSRSTSRSTALPGLERSKIFRAAVVPVASWVAANTVENPPARWSGLSVNPSTVGG
eukprot:CAMPEP_0204365522 /NCGR_PEP_ID=MMETSP0469-20131031/41968_1 /ASSEMBLY_ACC=CAM_ASM_000384 /TAXON_ID=2969 /ORGANISM="Oxyrrhis marina" /LENGTH=57 /DNA_ID=CAMNT_0051354589 /DNA_START=333 /DNA_END=503 /DNA_ORIENTATION=+